MSKKIFGLLSLLLIASMFLAACGAGTSNATNEPAANEPAANDTATNDTAEDTGDTAASAAPPFKNPDTYVYVSFGEPETLDPAWTYETTGSGIENNIYEGVVWFEKDKTDSFVGVLATDWAANDAGNVWTFNIRDGVTFHAGGTMEPHDIAYSMQRALLQDRTDGPHWMTHEVFFGTYSMLGTMNKALTAAFTEAGGDAEEYVAYESIADATPEDLVAACEYVKSAIVADDEAGTVTYNLANPAPWFLAILANSFAGATYDQEWMAENGDWDGDCATWGDFYDPAAEDTILFNEANGTGPYMLDHWTPGEEIVLVANENYWRADDDPMWEGGPSGVASIPRFVYLIVDEFGTRLAMYEAGDADFIEVDPQFYSQLEPEYGSVYCFDPENEVTCPAEVDGGWMQVFSGYQRPTMTPAQFNEAINAEGGNVLMGSGELDGNGIPSDFFTDVHIRRAFSYCMDYDTMISEALDGQGAQAQGPIIQGMMGYRDDGYVYTYDLDKCAEEFQLSETGVWDTGFYMQIAYNTGNETRRLAAEILKAGVEAVNPNFQITVVGMPWPVLLNNRTEGKLPIYVGGWLEDFHDPHNWVHPFLHSQGTYGRVANIQDPLKTTFDDLIEEGASYTDPEMRRPIYEEIQLLAQTEAPMIWLYQAVGRSHFSPWMQGWYFNGAYSGTAYSYVYALSKVAP
ncbi:ABC transporter substrate-binding protein [bacterium]|nr:ABC transporter substrate-binding protein [bacterium]